MALLGDLVLGVMCWGSGHIHPLHDKDGSIRLLATVGGMDICLYRRNGGILYFQVDPGSLRNISI